jgi:hypothetical protein
MDKPEILYDELNEEAKSHLLNLYGVSDQSSWEKNFGNKICCLCSSADFPANHLGNRCIRLFCRSNKGQLYYGVATNAKQLRFQLASTGKINFATVLALSDGVAFDTDARPAAEYIVDCIVDDSEVLSMYFAGTISEVSDDAAVSEFDRCQENLLAHISMPLTMAATRV